MLLPRFLTALVGAPLFLAALFFGGLPLFFVVLGIVWLGVREFYTLAEETGYPCYSIFGQIVAILWLASIFVNGGSIGVSIDNLGTPAVLTLIFIALIARSILRKPSETSLSEWSVTFFGLFYVAWSLSHLLLLRDLRPNGMGIVFFLVSIIWTADTLAYLVGVRFGKRRIAEAVSPKKSWEGTLAGLMGAALVGLVFQSTLLRLVLNPLEAVLLSIGTAVVALISDLGESLLKRGAGVKDSSLLLPGHGGILDRFDSFILAAPFFYYYWAILKH
jgi:phosphatidate cytidylyltransferase